MKITNEELKDLFAKATKGVEREHRDAEKEKAILRKVCQERIAYLEAEWAIWADCPMLQTRHVEGTECELPRREPAYTIRSFWIDGGRYTNHEYSWRRYEGPSHWFFGKGGSITFEVWREVALHELSRLARLGGER